MDVERSRRIRSSAYFFSVVLYALALLTLFGTIIAVREVSNAGSDFLGVSAARDPGTWAVGAIGVTVSAIEAGIGFGLGLLSAIYDRQQPPAASRTLSPPSERDVSPMTVSATDVTTYRSPPAPTPAVTPSPTLPPRTSTTTMRPKKSYPEGTLMDHLTRERHVFPRRSD